MSHYDYVISKKIAVEDPPFASIIMAAIRKADTINANILKDVFPEIFAELKIRYWAPGGLLPEEVDKKKFIPLKECSMRKGGRNEIPTTPRPNSPPKGQGGNK